MAQVWLGGVYLKDEGGYEIVLRALDHYKKRLRTVGSSPEVAGAPMFAQIVQQEAEKAHGLVDKTIEKIRKGLEDQKVLNDLQQDVPLLEKALYCYKSDIEKAKKGEHVYYSKIVSDIKRADADHLNIENALGGLNRFA